MVRVGSGAEEVPNTPESPPDQQPQTEAPPQTGAFSGVPHLKEAIPVKINNFPTFTGLFNEIGSVASIIDQINRISDFVSGRPMQSVPEGQQQAAQQPQQHPLSEEELQLRLQQIQQLQQQAAQQPVAAPAPPQGAQQPQQPQEQVPQQPAQQPQQPAPTQDTYTPAVEPAQLEVVEETLSEEEIEQIYEDMYQYIEFVMQAAQEGREFTVEQAFILISRAVDTPLAPDILYRRAIYTRETSEAHSFASSVVLHSVNVAVYAIKIGQGLSYNRNQLIDLGVAAFLHDVGMVTLPPDLFSKGQFTQNDIALLHEHPAKGRAILQQLGADYQWLSEVAYQEHEREDGSGYPQNLTGNLIHEYAKIIGVADIYAGLTRSRPDRRGMLPFEAVKEILQTRKQEFDPRVVRILLKTLSAFPVGSMVKLNSGIVGRVVDTDIDSPLRPAIQIMFDIEGRPVHDNREIRLREHPILHITDTVTPEEMGIKPGS